MFVLNQTATDAAGALRGLCGLPDAVAQPFSALRNDHQDALTAGLAVGEYAPGGTAAAEISFIDARLISRPAMSRERRAAPTPGMRVEAAPPLAPLSGIESSETG